MRNSAWPNRIGNSDGESADATARLDARARRAGRRRLPPRRTSASGALRRRIDVRRSDAAASGRRGRPSVLANLEHHHRHVVVRLGVADERLAPRAARARGCRRRPDAAGSASTRASAASPKSSPSASIASVMPSVYSTIDVAGADRPRVFLEHLLESLGRRPAAGGRAPCRPAR